MLTLDQLKQELDGDQFAAVTAPLGNMLCVANAGSGKTRVLTYRIAHLIAEGEPEDSFLMLTFTVKAAREMMDRIKGLLGKNNISITGGTFHSIANTFIKKFYKELGYDKKTSILDATDSKDLMGLAREHYCAFANIPTRGFPTATEINSAYSLCRNTGLDFTAYMNGKEESNRRKSLAENLTDIQIDAVLGIVKEYEQRKRDLDKVDFDDLLLGFDKLLDAPRVQKYVRDHYPNVFVDEYQDINVVQDSIIRKLTKETQRLTAVGDDAQCIYGFRGSEVPFIRSFVNSFPGAAIYPIRNNYRSSDKIVDLALAVINESKESSQKEMIATKSSNVVPTYRKFQSEKEQADYIVSKVREEHEKGAPYDEMAVLVRMNRLPRPIEVALTNARIPVSMDCGVPFYSRTHIRTVVNFMKVLENPKDELAFWNLVGTTDGVGPKTAQKLFNQFEKKDFDLAMLSSLSVPKKSSPSFITLSNALLSARKFLDQSSASGEAGGSSQMQKLLDHIMKEWCKDWMRKEYKTDNLKGRKGDISTLREALADYDSMDDFLDNIALAGNEAEKGPEGKVRITTIHRAKGLEWDVVFLPYLADDILPYSFQQDALEEERRLCYVAITRGRKQVYMSYPQFIPSIRNFSGYPSTLLSGDAREFFR